MVYKKDIFGLYHPGENVNTVISENNMYDLQYQHYSYTCNKTMFKIFLCVQVFNLVLLALSLMDMIFISCM